MGALEQRLGAPLPCPPTRNWPPASSRVDARRPLQPGPPPLGSPGGRGRGAGGRVRLGSLIHSFSADGSLRPAVL